MAESNQVKNFVKDEDNEYSPLFGDFTTEWIGDQEFAVASFNEGQTKKPRLSDENLILSTFRENFPEKFQKFELKMITSSEPSFSKPSDETPNSKPSDETPNSKPSDETPNSKPTEEISNNSTISTPKPTDEDSTNQEIDYSPQSPELFLPAPTTHEYLLQPELLALSELVDSMRVDLLQTSTLINYMQDYASRLDFRK